MYLTIAILVLIFGVVGTIFGARWAVTNAAKLNWSGGDPWCRRKLTPKQHGERALVAGFVATGFIAIGWPVLLPIAVICALGYFLWIKAHAYVTKES